MQQYFISVLLATYNSALVIRQQLDSLLEQSIQNFEVYIRDDGSTDNTLDIINLYINQYPDRFFLLDSDERLGAKNSFMKLLEIVNNEYYMFCDHDDVWLPFKIEKTLEKMKKAEAIYPQLPILIHTDLSVVDDDFNIINTSFWKYSKLKQSYLSQFNYLGVCNGVTGCTMMINQQAKLISFPFLDEASMHDWWIALRTAFFGKIFYVDAATILYRQHWKNEIGAQKINAKYFFNKLISFILTIKKQNSTYLFLNKLGYGPRIKYYWYKLSYFIIRNL